MVFFNDRNAALYGESAKDNTDKNHNNITEDDYLIHSYEDALIVCDTISKIENVSSVVYI